MNTIVRGRGLNGSFVGEAIVVPLALTFFGDVDLASGALLVGAEGTRGLSIAGKVLVFKAPSGGQGNAWKIGEMVKIGSAPAAIVVHRSNNVLVSGCILARIPLVADTDADPTLLIAPGDIVALDGNVGTVCVIERRSTERA